MNIQLSKSNILFLNKIDDIIDENGSSNNTNSAIANKKANFMLMDLLEKYFNENPWSDLTNLDELIKLTGLDEAYIKV